MARKSRGPRDNGGVEGGGRVRDDGPVKGGRDGGERSGDDNNRGYTRAHTQSHSGEHGRKRIFPDTGANPVLWRDKYIIERGKR